jgi:hypothetical protein
MRSRSIAGPIEPTLFGLFPDEIEPVQTVGTPVHDRVAGFGRRVGLLLVDEVCDATALDALDL